MEKNTKLKIQNMSHGAFAVGRIEEQGLAIFVENACPGDELEVEIYDTRNRFAYAHINEIKTASALRMDDPPCSLHKICGGCQWQHIQYAEQLNFKRQNIIDLFRKEKIGQLEIIESMPAVLGMDDLPSGPWNYRNKIIYPVETVESTQRLKAGYYKRNTHELINVKHCPIQYSIFDEIMEECKELCSEYGLGKPPLRHIAMRSNFQQDEVLLTFIVRAKELKSKLKSTICTKIFPSLQKKFPIIKGCSLNYNDLSTNVIIGEKTETTLGVEHITETLEDIKLKLSATSFLQINNQQFTKILKLIKAWLDEDFKAQERISILDAYSGIGTISLSLAKAFNNNTLNITAIEVIKSAVADGKLNAKLNEVKNIDFKQGRIEDHIEELKKDAFDIIITNPPRKGCSNRVLDAFAETQAKKIIYVSCNPATLARDIKYLEQSGFKLEKLQAVDMFPHTFHVESLALLTR